MCNPSHPVSPASPPFHPSCFLTAQPASLACTPSTLGYACSLRISPIAVVHWSPGGSMPLNDCTGAASSDASHSGLLHMVRDEHCRRDGALIASAHTQIPTHLLFSFPCPSAPPSWQPQALEANTSGYIGLGFASGNRMFNSDVVWGYVSGSRGLVDVWNIPR